MPTPTLSTTEVSARLQFTVTGALIEALGIKPAEFVKGKPRWKETDLKPLSVNLAAHVLNVGNGRAEMLVQPKAPVKAATPVDDDEL